MDERLSSLFLYLPRNSRSIRRRLSSCNDALAKRLIQVHPLSSCDGVFEAVFGKLGLPRVWSCDDVLEAAACDFIRRPVPKRLKGIFQQDMLFKQHRTQKRPYEELMRSISMTDIYDEDLFRKAELFRLIMGLNGEPGDFSFEDFCWRRDLLAKLMKQKGNSTGAAGGHSNTVRSRRGQFSAAPYCHYNNVGHQPGGSDYYSVARNNNMMNLGGGSGANDQAEVGWPNYGTNNNGRFDQMIGIQPDQGYGGGNNTNSVTGNGIGVGQFPSNGNNIRGGSGDDIIDVGGSHGGHGMGAGHLPSIGNNIGGNSVDGTGNNINNIAGNGTAVGQFPPNGNNIRGGSGDNINNIGGSHSGDGMGAGHLPSVGNNIGGSGVDPSWNRNGMGIGLFPSNGSNMGGSGVDGNGNIGCRSGGNGMVIAEFPSNGNNMGGNGVNGSRSGNSMGIEQFPSSGYNIGGSGVNGSGNIGGGHGGDGMLMVEFPSNGNNMQGSGVDASGNTGGDHGGNGVVIAQFPSTANNTGGNDVFGSDLRSPSALFGGSISDWIDAELNDEELWAALFLDMEQ